MGMFFEMLNSINDPHCQGSIEQLENIMSGIEAFRQQQQLNPETMQTILSAISRPMQSALRQSPSHDAIYTSLKQADLSVLLTVLTPPIQAQIVPTIAPQTAIEAAVIQRMMPSLLALVCQFFQLGIRPSPIAAHDHRNHVLTAFVKGDRFGCNDLGDIWRLSNRFLYPALDR